MMNGFSGQAINIHIYIANQISTRDIQEKTLFLNSMPNSIKDGPKRDEYIKELFVENKKIHATH